MERLQKESAVLRSNGRSSRPDHTGVSSDQCGVQSSITRVGTNVDGTGYTGCWTSQQDSCTGSQGSAKGLAGNSEAGRPARDREDSVTTYPGGGKRVPLTERFDLIPAKALIQIAKAMAEGSVKYGDNNWRNLPRTVIANHMLRHVTLWQAGDRSEPHLGHAAANLLMLLEMECEDGEGEAEGIAGKLADADGQRLV